MQESSDEHLYSFKADYPQVSSEDSPANDRINQEITTFITRLLQTFRSEAIARTTEKHGIMKVMSRSLAWDDLSISYNVSLFTPHLFSVEFRLQSYFAMAVHPNTTTRTLNFRINPPMQLELKDIFKISSNFLELLAQFCVSDLHNQQPLRFYDPKKRAEELKNKQDEWILSGAAPKLDNYERFVFAKGGMRVFFDPYQVGSYAEGRYEVFVPVEVLLPALKESIAALLVSPPSSIH